MIRTAQKEDAPGIAQLMLLAMDGLVAKFRGSNDPKELEKLLVKFIEQLGNQYSYNQVKVFEIDGQIVGSLTAYDGGQIELLRRPFFDFIIANYHPEGFDMELESEEGEFYIDVIAVNPKFRNGGIGKKLLDTAIHWAQALGHQKIGLLVDINNAKARKLYESLGFQKVGTRHLLGSTHEHLVLSLSES